MSFTDPAPSPPGALIVMTLTATPAALTTIDLRRIPPGERHPLVFSTFGALAAGQAMELVNDHDPQPLFLQFQGEMPSAFDWERLEAGPQTWRVRVTRLESPGPGGRCCGCCGGG